MTVKELFEQKILPATNTIIKRIEELEEKQKKIEKEASRYWFFINLLLSLQILIAIICSTK